MIMSEVILSNCVYHYKNKSSTGIHCNKCKNTDSDCKWSSREVVYLFDIPERLGETCHSFCTLSKHIYCL